METMEEYFRFLLNKWVLRAGRIGFRINVLVHVPRFYFFFFFSLIKTELFVYAHIFVFVSLLSFPCSLLFCFVASASDIHIHGRPPAIVCSFAYLLSINFRIHLLENSVFLAFSRFSLQSVVSMWIKTKTFFSSAMNGENTSMFAPVVWPFIKIKTALFAFSLIALFFPTCSALLNEDDSFFLQTTERDQFSVCLGLRNSLIKLPKALFLWIFSMQIQIWLQIQ